MLFQTLDDKTECVGIYADNKLMFDVDQFPEGLKSTWSYSPYLRGMDVDYASLYLEGKSISDVIPEFLHDDWSDVSEKILAFKRSLSISKVNQDENCFFDLVPERFLTDFCEVKNSITRHVLNTITKPKRYDYYKHVSMLLGDIACQPVTVDVKKVSSYLTSKKIGNQAKAVMECSPFVRYNQFGTVTGRLSTKKNSFPILTLNKSLRHAISPQNNYFVELDFNGAEVRTLLGMLGAPQPAGDVHDFHLANVFSSSTSREQAKVLFFSWLYGSKKMAASAEGKKLENFYDRPALLDRFYSNSTITTPFGKVMNDVDRHLALNYLVQSTTAELTLKQALKIDYLLRRDGSGSTIAFLIHDAIVLDMKKEDEWLLPNIKKLMSSTNFGKFVINTKAGKTLGTMRKNKIG
jgi:hypothetical protein